MRSRELKSFKGYHIIRENINNTDVYVTINREGNKIEANSLKELKKLIRSDVNEFKKNNIMPSYAELKRKGFTDDWMVEIINLLSEFGRIPYYDKIINDTIRENPGMDNNGLYRMAHKKVIAAI